MKKRLCSLSLLTAALMLFGSCSESGSARADALISEIVSEASASAEAKPNSALASQQSETTTEKNYAETYPINEEPVAVDLTKMNSTMVYSVIYDIMTNTDRYYDRTIMLDGFFDTSLDEKYYFVVVPDATACCMQGLEFKLDDSKVYPDDYPEKKADIRVRGTLEKYDEDGQTYCYINADWVKVL